MVAEVAIEFVVNKMKNIISNHKLKDVRVVVLV